MWVATNRPVAHACAGGSARAPERQRAMESPCRVAESGFEQGPMTRALVVGDLHLPHGGDRNPARALVSVLAKEPDATVVFAGDALDLAAEPVETFAEAAARAVQMEPVLSRALAERAARGVRTVFVAGNHDAAIARPDVTRALHDALDLTPRDRAHVVAEPWFHQLADGAVHIEHGHVYDPDGAPTHPLASIVRDDVGIAILRRFIVPVDGHFLVAHNAEAPLPLLMRVIRKYGARAPWVIGKYFQTAFSTWLASGARFPIAEDRAEGRRHLQRYADDVGLDADMLALLLDAHATPTRADATATFLRLYLDRVLATTAIITGTTLAAAGAAAGAATLTMAGLPLATVGALSLTASMLGGVNRYRGRPEELLAAGAERAAEITGAKTVVLGHIHVDATGPRYRNTASFAFAKDHPYLVVEDDGSVTRAHASAG